MLLCMLLYKNKKKYAGKKSNLGVDFFQKQFAETFIIKVCYVNLITTNSAENVSIICWFVSDLE